MWPFKKTQYIGQAKLSVMWTDKDNKKVSVHLHFFEKGNRRWFIAKGNIWPASIETFEFYNKTYMPWENHAMTTEEFKKYLD